MKAALLLLLLLLSGCLSSQPFQPVAYYDLAALTPPIPAAGTPAPVTLRIGSFASASTSGTRMVYRKSEHRLVEDEYHRWIDRPELLVERQFLRGFHDSGRFEHVLPASLEGADWELRGSLIELEADPDLRAHVRVAIHLASLKTGEVVYTWQYHQIRELSGANADAFANSAAQALDAVIREAIDHVAEIIAD
ncbi:MAG: ABC-type uncharacterized transport system auxiliary subunit [Rhodothermales bacterium]|jgi:ABC-type uncharacterized transport system auxiliary subunit